MLVKGRGGGGSDLKRAGVMAAFIKTLHLLLKADWGLGGDQCWQVTNVVSLLITLILITSFHREV